VRDKYCPAGKIYCGKCVVHLGSEETQLFCIISDWKIDSLEQCPWPSRQVRVEQTDSLVGPIKYHESKPEIVILPNEYNAAFVAGRAYHAGKDREAVENIYPVNTLGDDYIRKTTALAAITAAQIVKGE
jgi:hypothetical protein